MNRKKMVKKKSKRISLKDIAQKVGCSTALVSYVLNGHEKEKRVSDKIVARINHTLKEMKYKPNHIARSLRYGTTQTIGLIVTDIANPFFGSLSRQIEDEANKSGYTVIIGSSDENFEKSEALINTMLNRQVDGIIIVPADGCQACLDSLIKDEFPLVMIDRCIPELISNYVVLDNFSAGYDAVKYLIERGYKKIGMIAYKSTLVHMKERIRGYEEAMTDLGLDKERWIRMIRYDSVSKDMRKTINSIKGRNGNCLDAVLFATNTLSIAGLYCVQELKFKIPDDLAIIGFDGNEAFDFFYAPITFVQQPVDEMGKEAVRILLDQISGSKKLSRISLQSQLIKRASC